MEPLLTVPRFPISFAGGHVALAFRAAPGTDLGRGLRAMGLTTGVPVIVPVGAGSRPAQLDRLGPLLEKVVATVAEEVGATVVGPGAAGGLGEALGGARRRKMAGFPMIGVASDGSDREDLEPEHTHFVLVPADDGAGVARWVAEVGIGRGPAGQGDVAAGEGDGKAGDGQESGAPRFVGAMRSGVSGSSDRSTTLRVRSGAAATKSRLMRQKFVSCGRWRQPHPGARSGAASAGSSSWL